MHIKKFKNSIHLKLEGECNLEDVIQNNDMFWNDLYIYHSQMDGWIYLYDTSTDTVYQLNDYHMNYLKLLLCGEMIILIAFENDETYEGYEWNQ